MIDRLVDGRYCRPCQRGQGRPWGWLMHHVLNRAAGRATLLEKGADCKRIASRLGLESSLRTLGRPRKPR